jgi:hypothetical protein
VNRTLAAASAVAVLFLAAHLPLLPLSLGDVDSINFALAIRDFDVAQHQPHPPGYPIYVAATKAVNLAVGSEARTLSLLSAIGGAAGVLAMLALYRGLVPANAGDDPRPLAAAVIGATAPLYWFSASRPLSDVPGLAAAVALQAMIVAATSGRALVVAALAAGLAAGIRSQIVWLTVPLLALQWARRPVAERWRAAPLMAAAYAAGALVWAIPLLLLTGGPAAYWRALVNQGAEDLGGVVMLWTQPTPRQFLTALRNTFLLPWGHDAIGIVAVGFAAVGVVSMTRWPRGRQALVTLAAAYGPYYLFDLLFQETATTRYALPVLVPVAFAAVEGAWAVSRRAPLMLAAGLALVSLTLTTQALYGYSRSQAPAFRMIAEMASGAEESDRQPVLAMHRRASFDMRRPMQWAGTEAPRFQDRLASPPKREWLELVKYWNQGGTNPVWFIADPLRSDLALIERPAPVEYRWPFDPSALLGGVRPNEMDWYRFEAPGWYVSEGWALTPETAGVATEDRKGPGIAPIEGWVRRTDGPVDMLIGGRNMGGAPAILRVTLDGREIEAPPVAPGFFLHTYALPSLPPRAAGAVGAAGAGGNDGNYARLAISADSPQVAIEQFAANPDGRVIFGFDEGWYEQEYNPATGRLWRWASERANLRVRSGGRGVVVRLTGEIEASSSAEVTISVGDRVIVQERIGRHFTVSAPVPSELLATADARITIESSSWYVPAEGRFSSSPDRRRLALKVYECEVDAAP